MLLVVTFAGVKALAAALMWRPDPSSKRNQTSQDEKIDTVIGVVFFVLMAMQLPMLAAFLYKGDIDSTRAILT